MNAGLHLVRMIRLELIKFYWYLNQ